MKLSKILLSAMVVSFLSIPALAEETDTQSSELKANLRRLGFEYSKTDVSHAKDYENSPVSQFNADSQSLIKGVLDFALEYNQDSMRWNNGLFMEYGKTKLKPVDEPTESTENSDKILLSSKILIPDMSSLNSKFSSLKRMFSSKVILIFPSV